ncbi:uncharacterized protein LOC132716295 [Ruditapes philippinarum]|uniref:uncharacterized protein LOC132716295 n=1 Tax=Ruditapes philippinarum TaxID=129788 RepID=UPI00295BB68F|nr:uncharacterized protein LOC132716295 [Ruditapes philippinarum]
MAEGTVEKNINFFRFILQKLPKQQELQKIKAFRYCIKSNYFFCHFNDNHLIVSSFQNAEAKIVEDLEHVEGFALQTDVESFKTGKIATINKDGELLVYEYQGDKYVLQEKLDLRSALTKVNITEFEALELTSFKREIITVYINKSYLVQCSIKDHQCDVLSNITLPETISDVNKYVIIGGVCTVLDIHASMLLFYSIDTGKEISKIDIRQLDISSIQAWTMSDQFKYLALVLQSGDIHLVDLHSYCTTSPQQGRQPTEQ